MTIENLLDIGKAFLRLREVVEVVKEGSLRSEGVVGLGNFVNFFLVCAKNEAFVKETQGEYSAVFAPVVSLLGR